MWLNALKPDVKNFLFIIITGTVKTNCVNVLTNIFSVPVKNCGIGSPSIPPIATYINGIKKNIEEIEDSKIVVLINNEEKECDVLFTYYSEDLDYTIIGYTDNTYTNNKLNIYVSKFNSNNEKTIETITDPEELEIANEIVEKIKKEYKI